MAASLELLQQRAESGALAWAHPLVREWFGARFASPTEPQERGWPAIVAGRSTLICAPTGSGKTLAAFLACIDRLVRQALAGELQDRTEVLYVSPLKALGNDVQKNLEAPLGEILQLAGQRGLLMPEIRTAVRTGDTLAPARRAMLARPPHILVTTPESLFILLTSPKGREILRTVETAIVDEIHAVADDKRGAHLALSLERLEALTGHPLVRIGLSATQRPIATIARFLTGSGRPEPVVVEISARRELDLAVEVPPGELGAVASNQFWEAVYDRIAILAREHRSTLVFVNTRRLAERVAHHLRQRLGEDAVAAHHGSLSRRLRLDAEQKLKSGQLRALVATASLELGIDIGAVELACQIGSPRSIATGLQRIGRSGHWRGAVPKGRFFATTRDELIECAALVHAIRQGDLDRIAVPPAPLDILAQQLIAACAVEDWNEDGLYSLARGADPYRDLPREDFESVLAMTSEGVTARRGRYGAYLHRDRVNRRVTARRGARLAAITSGGAIPESALYTVIAEPDGSVVGTMDEDYAVESMSGDIVLLGNTSWRIRRIETWTGKVLVEDAHGAAPNVPFWRGEAPGRTAELSAHVSLLRQKIDALSAPGQECGAATEWLQTECGLDASGAAQAAAYIAAGRNELGAVPSLDTVIAERFFDEGGGMQLVIHAPFGSRINKAWGLALRKRFCRSFNFELQAAATENGLNVSLGEQHSFPLADVFQFLHADTVRGVLEQATLASPIFGTRWRWDAGRALALLRFAHGKKVPLQIQRMRSDDLLAAVFPDAAACQDNIVGDIRIPHHPLIREVMKDVLTEALDLEGLKAVLSRIAEGRVKTLAIDTTAPSQFSHEILNANPYAYLDDAPLEERRARAVEMRRSLPEDLALEAGRLDATAVAQVAREAWPEVRDADELEDVLETLIALPEDFAPPDLVSVSAAWGSYFEELTRQRRATRAEFESAIFWVCASKAKAFASVYPGARFLSGVENIDAPVLSREDALLAAVQGWLSHSGPVTIGGLGKMLRLPGAEIEAALARVEASGMALRGKFTGAAETEWCERRLLARIHRYTLGALRKEITPVTAAQFLGWLAGWQHVAPGTQTAGARGVLEVVRQLQGFEAPANTWESQILPPRIAGYDPRSLDELCLAGAIGWGRLSPHPALLDDGVERSRRISPSSVAPLTFFVREDADWIVQRNGHNHNGERLSPGAREALEFLRQSGASFFPEIVRGTGRLKAETETALWELVAAGSVTADGFDNLRALIDPKRRAGQGRGRDLRPRNSAGRWCLLPAGTGADPVRSVEAACGVLLGRYGIVFRDILARESVMPRWRELLPALRRLEARGEIRGGRFVSGFSGEQFALPMAIESLRAFCRGTREEEIITVAAADPLNLAGILLPGDRVAANSGRSVDLRFPMEVSCDSTSSEGLANPNLEFLKMP
ncbi:MAG: DEAD/DEAH box helicase [Terriglobia bacterium]